MLRFQCLSEVDVTMGHSNFGLFLLCSLLFNGLAEDAVLTTDPHWSTFFTGESVTFICDMKEGEDDDWEYAISKDGGEYVQYTSPHKRPYLYIGDSGKYQCRGRDKWSQETKKSNTVSLTVLADKPRAILTPGPTTIPIGGSVTLTCSVEISAGWKYLWFRRTPSTSEESVRTNVGENKVISVSRGGIYRCVGVRGEPGFYSYPSDDVTIDITYSNRVVLTQQPSWSQLFSGESITLTCQVLGGEGTGWDYKWEFSRSATDWTNNNNWAVSVSESSSGDYRCRSRPRDDSYSLTQWSNTIRLSLSSKPKAQLTADTRNIQDRGSVILSCSVKISHGWKYFWYRDDKSSNPLTTQDAVFLSLGQISVSQEGTYWCRGGRGDTVYCTEYSDPIIISNTVPNKAVVSLQPSWPKIYSGEKITLRCEIDGGDTEWEYVWLTPRQYNPPNQNEISFIAASSLHSGTYDCKGKMKSGQQSSTYWSDSFKLKLFDKPRPVLTVSPSWLSPGASVTLKCEIEHPSAGWRFYWYEAVPGPSDTYIHELLPGVTNGTAEDSHVIDGQTHTAGYTCRAGRGDPVYYSDYSEPQFVWSGDFHSAASLTVNPNRVQHFTPGGVSLTCEGNSTEWRVMRLTNDGLRTHCVNWGTMTGSTCNVPQLKWSTTVYWCESLSASSNAVNITGQSKDVILVSPVHPVTEGASVTLSCKLKTEDVLSNVFFYKNDKLVQNDSRGELSIPAVSESDEGFYKCQYSGGESPQSWMAVKPSQRSDSSFPTLLIIGLVCGILLIILLLLLLCCFKQSKGICFSRSQSSGTDHTNDQGEAQRTGYTPPLNGDANLYESVKSPEDTRNDESPDVTYSAIELKDIAKKGKRKKPEESCVYSDVKIRVSTDDNLMYAQVVSHNKGKAKKNKGKSAPAAADETVYSEVKPGSTLDK